MKPTTINEFAEYYGLEVGAVILAVIKYLVDDPTTIHPSVRAALADATAEDIEEALETIADDIKSTRNKGVI